MCSESGNWTWLQLGFPIRTSTDQSSVGSSPWLIAASYVLHRFSMPRHPPCALINLAITQRYKFFLLDARVHYAVLKIRAGCNRSLELIFIFLFLEFKNHFLKWLVLADLFLTNKVWPFLRAPEVHFRAFRTQQRAKKNFDFICRSTLPKRSSTSAFSI